MRIEDDWVYPENMEDARALGPIKDGDEYNNGVGSWVGYYDSVGKMLADKPNPEIDPLDSRRPFRNYIPQPVEADHFI